MQSVIWVQINFDAGHAPVEDPCPNTTGPHGHRYSIRVYRSAPYDPGKRIGHDQFRDSVMALRDELQGVVIDDLLPGISTRPIGIAAWVLERIPLADRARVSINDTEAAEVHRETDHR